MIKTAFPPVIDRNSRILILGSMPGERSLMQQQYYANKQNAFWKIMFHLFNNDEALTHYPDKLTLLKTNRIALWDVFESCQREGSLDSNIKNGVVNGFDALFKSYPNIQLVLFNGAAAYKAFKRQITPPAHISLQVMPSTSPAHTMAYNLKLSTWQNALY